MAYTAQAECLRVRSLSMPSERCDIWITKHQAACFRESIWIAQRQKHASCGIDTAPRCDILEFVELRRLLRTTIEDILSRVAKVGFKESFSRDFHTDYVLILLCRLFGEMDGARHGVLPYCPNLSNIWMMCVAGSFMRMERVMKLLCPICLDLQEFIPNMEQNS